MNIFKRLKLWIIDEITEFKYTWQYLSYSDWRRTYKLGCRLGRQKWQYNYLSFYKQRSIALTRLNKNLDKNFIDKQRSRNLIKYNFKEKVDKIL